MDYDEKPMELSGIETLTAQVLRITELFLNFVKKATNQSKDISESLKQIRIKLDDLNHRVLENEAAITAMVSVIKRKDNKIYEELRSEIKFWRKELGSLSNKKEQPEQLPKN